MIGTPNWLTWALAGFFLLHSLLHCLADQLNLNATKESIPDGFEGIYDADKYETSQAYLADYTRFGQLTRAVDLLVLLIFWFWGGFAFIDELTRSLGWGPVNTGLAYFACLAGLKGVVDQPFALYATFVIEQRYGFNRTTWTTWMADRLKGLLLLALLGLPLLAGVLFLFHYAGDSAWLWCWLLTSGFLVGLLWIGPTWIMPLFNHFDPIDDGKLKEAILAYARSIRFPVENVYVMDGSKRSAKSNAFFTGFGRRRRIVLYDTLIERHSTEELVAVVAHEIGHAKLRHVGKRTLMGVVQAGVLFYLLSLVLDSPALFEAFLVQRPSVHAGLVFFSLLCAPLDLVAGLITQAVSRQQEYAADRFAVATTGQVRPLVNALKKLSAHNLSNLSPHPLTVLLRYTHPPVCNRVDALEKKSAHKRLERFFDRKVVE